MAIIEKFVLVMTLYAGNKLDLIVKSRV